MKYDDIYLYLYVYYLKIEDVFVGILVRHPCLSWFQLVFIIYIYIYLIKIYIKILFFSVSVLCCFCCRFPNQASSGFSHRRFFIGFFLPYFFRPSIFLVRVFFFITVFFTNLALSSICLTKRFLFQLIAKIDSILLLLFSLRFSFQLNFNLPD